MISPNVLFIQLSDEYGEDEQLSFEDMLELTALGLNWKVICLKNSPLYDRFLQFGRTKIIALENTPSRILDKALKLVIRKELDEGLNLIHIFKGDYLGSILPWTLRYHEVPVVITEGPSVRKRWTHWFQSLFYARIDTLLVPTLSLKRRIQAMRPVLEKRVRVIHPGLDLNIFNPDHFDFTVLRQKWGIEPAINLVGMIAVPEYTKAQATFVKAAASFLRNEELAKRTRFVIVGFQQEKNKELIDLINQFHLQDQIILVPEEDSIPKVLGTLDVFVLPSSKAVFGLQAIESLAMGTPILCASGQDSSEWIGKSQSGLLMRSGDSFDLQRKLRMILEDPEELKIMGQRAVRHAHEFYDRKKRTERLIEIYDRVLRRRHPKYSVLAQ